MSIANKCAAGLIWTYKGINRTGLLNYTMMRSLYISSYFTYKKYIEDSYARLIKHHGYLFKEGNILDIGANIGYTAFVFSKIVEEPFKIFAFEPEKRNVEFLKQASQKYQFDHWLISVAAAVGDQEGEIDLWYNEAHNGDHRILTEALKHQLQRPVKIQKTPVVTIDDYIKRQHEKMPISFVKIDVHGYELAVCHGMVDMLEQNPNVVVGFEFCPSVMEALGFQPDLLLRFFKERQYQFYWLNKENKIQLYDVEAANLRLRQSTPHDYIDILCTRRNLTES